MCGLAGVFDPDGEATVDRALLARMTRSLAHRGPDGEGLYCDRGIGLGSRRLAIIDRAGGVQPMFNEDRSVVAVHNGEIYNFPDLTAELRARGHRFRSHSDTEVIVHAWEEWGPACVERLRGMFALALWDQKSRTLFLARDRLGIKPLYYALAQGRLAFASELKALLVDPGLPRRIDPCAIEDYLAYGYIPDPRTIYRDVFKLRPGHWLTWRVGEPAPTERRYWELSFAPRAGLSADRAAEELLARLEDAVTSCLIADVPLGAFLSGGIDSSAVVAMMSASSAAPVNTCSIGFDEPAYDESRFAQRVADALGARHHTRRVRVDDLDLIERLPQIYDEPFADSSAIPTFRLSQLARERVVVALSGDGGDETFAGYRRYRWHLYEERVRRALPGRLRRPLFGALGAIYPKLDWAPRPLRFKSTLCALAQDSLGAYFQSVAVVPDGIRGRLYSQGMRRALQGYHAAEVIRPLWLETQGQHPLDQAQYTDLKTYLPGDILTKVDRASMAHSLEVRVPLLDHGLVEWAATVPPSLRYHRGNTKYVLKRALQGRLPDTVLHRRKQGFSVPLAAWLRGPLVERVERAFAGAAFAEPDFFDLGAVRRLLEQHRSGRWNHGATIWTLLMFAGFLDCVHSAAPEPLTAPSEVVPVADGQGIDQGLMRQIP